MMRVELMQTDHALQLSDDQRRAVEYLLAAAPGCGLHKLHVEELMNLCERIGSALDGAEQQGYDAGYTRAVSDCEEFRSAVIASRNLKRAHS